MNPSLPPQPLAAAAANPRGAPEISGPSGPRWVATGARTRRCRSRLALLLSAFLPACGYTFPSAPPAQTVAVQVVGNETMRQRLELSLTRALQEALVIYSPMRPAAKDRAEAVLEVDIQDARNRVLVSGRPEPLSEGSLALAVNVRLVDARSGECLRQFKVTDRAEFRVAVGEGESDAVREVATDLARKIVLGLEADF